MTKYNGLTWGAPGIQATNLLYLKNSEAAIEATTHGIMYIRMMRKRIWRLPVAGNGL